jgi:hypothetical protein
MKRNRISWRRDSEFLTMLADHSPSTTCGHFARDVQLPASGRHALLRFIAGELPRWRDFPGRPVDTSEMVLTDQLCSHLNSAARQHAGWDFLQFRTEVSDERHKGRKVDLAPKPCAATVWVEGRRHTQFDTLIPIECKRLPTPKDKDRDEREYVFSSVSSTGGIQRFKAGHHGSSHRLAAMIAYIQSGTIEEWCGHVSQWIADIVKSREFGWSSAENLIAIESNVTARTAEYRSIHPREGSLGGIELRHLWIAMN